MAIPRITVTQNDNGIKLYFNIKKDNRIESVLGSVTTFQLINTKTNRELKRECTLIDPTQGEVMYILTSEDLSVVGLYQTEIQTLYANGTRLTQKNPVIINVQPETVIG